MRFHRVMSENNNTTDTNTTHIHVALALSCLCSGVYRCVRSQSALSGCVWLISGVGGLVFFGNLARKEHYVQLTQNNE